MNYGNIVCYFAGKFRTEGAANRQHDIHETAFVCYLGVKTEETNCNAISGALYEGDVKRLK